MRHGIPQVMHSIRDAHRIRERPAAGHDEHDPDGHASGDSAEPTAGDTDDADAASDREKEVASLG